MAETTRTRPLRAAARPSEGDTPDRDPDLDLTDPGVGGSAPPEAGSPDATAAPDEATGAGGPTATEAARRAAAPPVAGATTAGGGRRLPSLDSLRDRVRAAPVRQLAEGLGLTLLGVGLLLGWVIHVSWTPLLDIGLLVVGAVLVVQSRLSSPARPLIALGVLLALIAAGTWRADTTLDGGLGRRTERPQASLATTNEYQLGTGQLTIDTRETTFTNEALRIRGEVGLGRIVVIVPEGATVVTSATAGGGNVFVFGERKVGPGVEERYLEPGSGDERISLDLRVGLGSVEVRRG